MNTIQKALAALAFISLLPGSAMAVGIGFYGEFNRGYEGYGGNLGGDMTGSNEYNGGNGGIIIDSAAAKNEIFNYRLRLGGGIATLGINKYTDIGMVHTFGVSPARHRGNMVRFWFGPRIGIHYLFAEMTAEPNTDALYSAMIYSSYGIPSYLPLLLMMDTDATAKLDVVRLDMGLVFAGFNFNFGDYFTLSMELGFDYGFRIGEIKSGEITGKAYGEGIEGFGAVSVMFRISDTYAEAKESDTMQLKVE